jgi:WD40 repeat protein/serine/threonine protein kinase
MDRNQTDTADRDGLLDEVLGDYFDALESGRAPGRAELLTRYPSLAAELEAFFADEDRLGRFAAPLRPAARAALARSITQEMPARPFAGYTLLRELGRGAMGVVYEAEQANPRRVVALKMIRDLRSAAPADVERFKNEAQAVAQLDHPHIVPIYEVGADDGQPYFTMKYLGGGSLADRLSDFAADPRAAARLMAAVARAVHHAHQRGVLHRDLKPANILLSPLSRLGGRGAGGEGDFEPHVADFGLAKRVDEPAPSAAGSDLTQTGTPVGTPNYMAPEQASGRRGAVTTATDVYGLGAILYALLTGRPPFRGETVLEVLERVKGHEPEPPRRLNPRVDRDLETVCLKCLAKDPTRRYASAAELADDLDRWLDGRPILARPVGRWDRLTRWCRRNPLVAGASAVAALSLGLAVVGLTVGLVLEARARKDADDHRVAAKQKTADLRLRVYPAYIHRAHELWQRGQLEESMAALAACEPRPGEEDLRRFEWYYLKNLADSRPRLLHTFPADRGVVYAAVFSPDGRLIATTGEQSAIDLWDARTFERYARLEGHSDDCNSLAFTPDGRLLASCGDDRTVRLWDVAERGEVATLTGHTDEVQKVAVSPDGALLASAAWDGTVHLWDVAARTRVDVLRCTTGKLYGVAFSPDGKTLATCGPADPTRVWDVATRRERLQLREGDHALHCAFAPEELNLALTNNRDYVFLATATTSGYVQVWSSTERGDYYRSLFPHSPGLRRFVQFGPDGSYVVSCGDFPLVQVCATLTREVLTQFMAHEATPDQPARVWGVAVSPDGRRLLTAGSDGTAKLWALPEYWPCQPYTRPKGLGQSVIAPDAPAVAYEDSSHRIHIWGLGRGLKPDALPFYAWRPTEGPLPPWAFSPDERSLAFWGAPAPTDAGRLLVWDLDRREAATRPPWPEPRAASGTDRPPDHPYAVAFARRGASLLALDAGGTLVEWDRPAGRSHAWGLLGPSTYRGLSVTADGRTAVICSDRGWRPWDVERRQWAGAEVPATIVIVGHCLAPDGKLLAVCDRVGMVRILDAVSGMERAVIPGNILGMDGVNMAFSPDGRTLAVADDEGSIRVWHVATGQELCHLATRFDALTALRFSADGRSLVRMTYRAKYFGNITVWRASPDFRPERPR